VKVERRELPGPGVEDNPGVHRAADFVGNDTPLHFYRQVGELFGEATERRPERAQQRRQRRGGLVIREVLSADQLSRTSGEPPNASSHMVMTFTERLRPPSGRSSCA
jgi:hypothetical protein